VCNDKDRYVPPQHLSHFCKGRLGPLSRTRITGQYTYRNTTGRPKNTTVWKCRAHAIGLRLTTELVHEIATAVFIEDLHTGSSGGIKINNHVRLKGGGLNGGGYVDSIVGTYPRWVVLLVRGWHNCPKMLECRYSFYLVVKRNSVNTKYPHWAPYQWLLTVNDSKETYGRTRVWLEGMCDE
jgi:hypothetical protein